MVTDPISYTEGVLLSEDSQVNGEVKKAFSSIIYWNALYSEKTNPICDSTRCMVFQGNNLQHENQLNYLSEAEKVDKNVIKYFNKLNIRENWLFFSKGGIQKWEKIIPQNLINKSFNTNSILNIQRYISRDKIQIQIQYPESEENLNCELFRNQLKLLSCPEEIHFNKHHNTWVFNGIGEGHGKGFNLELNKVKSQKGYSAYQLITETKW